MDFKKRITELLKAKKWSQYELAKRAGMHKSTIRNMLRTKNSPRIDTLEQVCKAFGISLSDFFKENTKFKELDVIVTAYQCLDEKKKQILIKIIELIN
ncbi:MAG: helix-turn-helix transcriptional regulator [Bacilli bacterium]|nr:helix-turn-helix transcriptional regulator [Bacilli bacterium]